MTRHAAAGAEAETIRGAEARRRSHFKHNVFMVDEAGELLEHFGGTEDYLLAAELYEAALKRWPKARIQMKEAARIIYDNKRRFDRPSTREHWSSR